MNGLAAENHELRFDPKCYTCFSGERVEVVGQRLQLHYRLSGPRIADIQFREVIEFEGDDMREHVEQSAVLSEVTRLLLQIAGVSYYKAAAPEGIIFQQSATSSSRVSFLRRLYQQGLAEFAETNSLDLKGLSVQFMDEANERPAQGLARKDLKKVLLPFGGGKDSLLSLQLLEETGFSVTLLVVGPNPVTEYLARKTGHPLITVKRTLDPKLIELNRLGAYNGHVPVTAVVSAIATLVALKHGFGAVVFSNERSANRGTQLDGGLREVNHQYSKGLDFERRFRTELAACGATQLEYFSLLRPFSELAICREFARRNRYLDGFISCNRNFRRTEKSQRPSWCLACPKCLFVHLSLAPFLDGETMFAIFGANPLDDLKNNDRYAALLEVDGRLRPFDCVGGGVETHAAFALLAGSGWARSCAVVEHYVAHWQSQAPIEAQDLVFAPEFDHCIPQPFVKVIDAVF